MKMIWWCAVAAMVWAAVSGAAEDFTTRDGQTYKNVSDFRTTPDGLAFSYDVGVSHAVVPYAQLPDDLRKKYSYDPFAAGLREARWNRWMMLDKKLAFSLDQLGAAEQKAKAENKLIGFVVVWDSFFTNEPARPMGPGSRDALAQFYVTFHNALVLVFVSHERELDQIPAAAKTGIFGPEAGNWAPKMAVVSADGSKFVSFIPYGEEQATGYDREAVIRRKIVEMKAFLDAHAAP